MSKTEALRKALEYDLDLVVVTERAVPPVARIVNFQRFLYEKRKEEIDKRKKDKTKEPKTLRIGQNISENDLKIKIKRAAEFLEKGHPVRFEMLFKGRAITHADLGKTKFEEIKNALSEKAKVEKDIERKGRFMTLLLGPK